MTKTQLTYFLTLARELSFTRSANALYVSQPAISKSISLLENELGFPLFDRNDAGLSLTAAGRRLSDYLGTAVSGYEKLVDELRANSIDPTAPIRIGCPETWEPSHIEPAIAKFRKTYPNVEVKLEACRLSDLMNRLHAGKIDCVLTHELYQFPSGEYTTEKIAESACGILYSQKHFGKVTDATKFAGTDFIVYDSDIEKRFANLIRTTCLRYDFEPKLRNTGNLPTAMFDVSCGKGIMYFTSWDCAVKNSLFSFFKVDFTLPVVLIYSPMVAHEMISEFASVLKHTVK